jgi:hypothetical protein
LRGTTKQTKVQPPQIEIVAEYAFDFDRTLRGLMVLCGVGKDEIEAKIQQRIREREIAQTDERVN